ncbi:hypothetical protein [Micromonospora ureilytica]|uniref:hypothetical protein n=1 Tax=Micromonospora ureilytica TaxID=709868 RepID=UPI002E1135D6|nr:hypothetical protein OHB55_10930 [Micromonospora ureilytica]
MGAPPAACGFSQLVDQEYRDLWVMRFADDGRCRSFEEWPFWPGQQPPDSPDGS